MSTDQAHLLEAALGYASRGWPVFPCAWIEGGTCSCKDPECESPGKHPLTPHGLLDATNDPACVRDFWTKFPKANIAIVTGAKSGIAAVDVDDIKLAKPELKKLLPEYDFKLVPLQKTGKGWHLIFSHPGAHVKNGTKFLPGMDSRGYGGYIMAAPSGHISGNQYQWKVSPNGSVPLLPELLLTAINGPSSSSSADRPKFDSSVVWEGIPEGQRDDQLFRYAGKMRHADTPRDLADRLIIEAAARCKPPFPERDALKKVDQAYKYPAGQTARDTTSKGHKDDALNEGIVVLVSDVQPKKLEWLWHSRIPLGKVTVLDGDPGLGKSLISIELAALLSTGKPMPNAATADFHEPAGAVFLSAEDDPEDTIQPRLALIGADLTRVVLLQAVRREDGISLPTIADLSAITQG
jgi:hypothetical protein